MHQIDPESETITSDIDSLYPYLNNDIEYGLFEDIVDSYYLDSHIKDDFQCNHDCYSQKQDLTVDDYTNTCTMTPCDFNVIDQHPATENANYTNAFCMPKPSGIHSQ